MLITFEGIDGCGKTTQIKLLAELLIKQGKEVVIIREPGGTIFSESIRSILLSHKFDIEPVTELLLFEASRSNLINKVIMPALDSGKIVVTDRFFDSTTAYQGYGRGLDLKSVLFCNDLATGQLKPDITIFLDVSIDTSIRRSGNRKHDRIELAGREFFDRVRNGFLNIAKNEPNRVHIIDAENEIRLTHNNIISLLNKHFPDILRPNHI